MCEGLMPPSKNFSLNVIVKGGFFEQARREWPLAGIGGLVLRMFRHPMVPTCIIDELIYTYILISPNI
jgi:hypothetical protein